MQWFAHGRQIDMRTRQLNRPFFAESVPQPQCDTSTSERQRRTGAGSSMPPRKATGDPPLRRSRRLSGQRSASGRRSRTRTIVTRTSRSLYLPPEDGGMRGYAILATNLSQNFDETFARRMRGRGTGEGGPTSRRRSCRWPRPASAKLLLPGLSRIRRHLERPGLDECPNTRNVET
jgi:hypothetical protein